MPSNDTEVIKTKLCSSKWSAGSTCKPTKYTNVIKVTEMYLCQTVDDSLYNSTRAGAKTDPRSVLTEDLNMDPVVKKECSPRATLPSTLIPIDATSSTGTDCNFFA